MNDRRIAGLLLLAILTPGCDEKRLLRGDWRVVQPAPAFRTINAPGEVQDILGFSRDGTRLIVQAASSPENIFAYETSSGRCVGRMWANPIGFKEDVLLGRGKDGGSVLAYDVMTWRMVYRKNVHPRETVLTTPPGTAWIDRVLVRLSTGKPIATLESPAAVTADLKHQATARKDPSDPNRVLISLRTLADNRTIWEQGLAVSSPFFSLWISRDDRYLVATRLRSDGFPPGHESPVRPTRYGGAVQAPVLEDAIFAMADGRRILPDLSGVQLTQGGGALLALPPHLVSRRGGGRLGPRFLYSLPEGRKLVAFTSGTTIVTSPGGVVAGLGATVGDPSAAARLGAFDETTGRRLCVVGQLWECKALSPKGRWLVIDSGGGQWAIVSTATGKPAIHLTVSVRQKRWYYVNGYVAFSPDERRVAVSMGRQVVLFDLPAAKK